MEKSSKNLFIWGSLGLLIPISMVLLAVLAVTSDEKNKQRYAQQHAEQLERIKAKEQAMQMEPASAVTVKAPEL